MDTVHGGGTTAILCIAIAWICLPFASLGSTPSPAEIALIWMGSSAALLAIVLALFASDSLLKRGLICACALASLLSSTI